MFHRELVSTVGAYCVGSWPGRGVRSPAIDSDGVGDILWWVEAALTTTAGSTAAATIAIFGAVGDCDEAMDRDTLAAGRVPRLVA